jgi:hypothetical protein
MKTVLSWNRKEVLVLCERAFHRIIVLPHDTVIFREWVKYNLPPEEESSTLSGNNENVITLSDETLAKWKVFLEEDRIKTEKEREKKEKMDRIKADPNYEKYRDAICVDGRTEDDYGFEMLFFLHKHLEETPKEELQKEFDAVNETVGEGGVTVEEYFEGLNPAVQRLKGYSEGAESFMKKVEVRLREVENPTIPVDQVITIMKDIYDNE